MVDGKPAAGVELVFYAEQPPDPELLVPTPRAYSDQEGRFAVSTYTGGDGLPAGEYRVGAASLTEAPPGADPESFQAEDRLKGFYADPETSGLKATIVAGENELPPFELSTKKK